MTTIDAKKFYNEVMPGKQGSDYEHARWHSTPVAEVGYQQTKTSVESTLPKDASITTVLEVGPGAGTWTKVLLTRYPEAKYTLLDISREMLDRAQQALGDTPIEYIESPFEEFLTETRFDYLFSSRMLEYVENKGRFAHQVAHLLKPHGRACFITKYPHYARRRLMRQTVSTFHTGQITPHALAKLFKQHGLLVERVEAVTVSVPFFKSAFLNRWCGYLVRALPLTFLTSGFVESYLITVTKRP